MIRRDFLKMLGVSLAMSAFSFPVIDLINQEPEFTPLADLWAAMEQMENATGYKPNRLIMSPNVYEHIMNDQRFRRAALPEIELKVGW